VFALGSLTLLGKGIFLLRPSSEGIGLSHTELAELTTPAKRKNLPSIPAQAAQVVQDFGTGGLLLWPLLNFGANIDQTWNHPPRLQVFAAGAIFFTLGWVVRRFTQREVPRG
jgi:hypothetical protein